MTGIKEKTPKKMLLEWLYSVVVVPTFYMEGGEYLFKDPYSTL